jgi:hypothetical protein
MVSNSPMMNFCWLAGADGILPALSSIYGSCVYCFCVLHVFL